MTKKNLFAGVAVLGLLAAGCGNDSPDPVRPSFKPENKPVDFSQVKAARQASQSPQPAHPKPAAAPSHEPAKPQPIISQVEPQRAWDLALRVTVDGFLGEPEEASDDFDIEISYKEEASTSEEDKKDDKPATEQPKDDPKKEEPKKEEGNKEEPKKDDPKKEEPKKEEPKKEEPKKEKPPAYQDPRTRVPPPNFSKKGPMPSGLPSFFDEYDKNGDGQIALYEWPRDKRAEFERLDRNGDGFLTPEEVLQGQSRPGTPTSSGNTSTSKPPDKPADKPAASDPKKEPPKPADPNAAIDEKFVKQAKETIRDYDSNKDGKLDKGELEKTRSLKFAVEKYDANKDGSLDEMEVAAWWRDGGPGGRGPGGGGPGGGPGGGWGSPENIAKRNIEQFDKNKDGKLSKEEFEANRWNRTPFKDVDTNGDGFADENELIEQAKKFTGGGRGPGGR